MAYGYNVYFTERIKNRVMQWNPDTGHSQVVAGGSVGGEQSLDSPYGLAFDSDRTLLIADKMNHRVVRVKKATLEHIVTKDVDDHRRTRFIHRKHRPLCPTSIFLERQGTLLVAYSDDYTIYRIHREGRLELVLGVPPGQNGALCGVIEHVDEEHIFETALDQPTAVVARRDGTVFFIERGYQIVRGYHPDTGLHTLFPLSQQRQWPKSRAIPCEMMMDDYHPIFPTGLALDADDVLYLSDTCHRCVWQVDVDGRRLRMIWRADASVAGPAAMNFGPDGVLWIHDYGSGRILGVRPEPTGLWSPVPETASTSYEHQSNIITEGAGLVCG
jgi:sugar lactone lactonase YvrE